MFYLHSETLLEEHLRPVSLLEFYSSLKAKNSAHEERFSEYLSPRWIYLRM